MIVYRYLAPEFALLAIQQQRLKVGRFHEFNDIFDARPEIIPPRRLSEVGETFKESLFTEITAQGGFICYCGTPDNLLVWSHYGMGHKGIALGFEYDLGANATNLPKSAFRLDKIDYPEDNRRPLIDLGNLDLPINDSPGWQEAVRKISSSLWIKGRDWSYEEEYRQTVVLENCTVMGSHHYWEIPNGMLKKVILGARCTTDVALILNSIRFAEREFLPQSPIEVKRARMAATYSVTLENL